MDISSTPYPRGDCDWHKYTVWHDHTHDARRPSIRKSNVFLRLFLRSTNMSNAFLSPEHISKVYLYLNPHCLRPCLLAFLGTIPPTINKWNHVHRFIHVFSCRRPTHEMYCSIVPLKTPPLSWAGATGCRTSTCLFLIIPVQLTVWGDCLASK